MAKMQLEGYAKFVRSFETQKGTAYSGVISNSKKLEDDSYANADIRFVYFGYDNEIQDNTLIHLRGMTDVDNYNPENPKLQMVAFEMLPVTQSDGKNKSLKKVDAETKDENPYG